MSIDKNKITIDVCSSYKIDREYLSKIIKEHGKYVVNETIFEISKKDDLTVDNIKEKIDKQLLKNSEDDLDIELQEQFDAFEENTKKEIELESVKLGKRYFTQYIEKEKESTKLVFDKLNIIDKKLNSKKVNKNIEKLNDKIANLENQNSKLSEQINDLNPNSISSTTLNEIDKSIIKTNKLYGLFVPITLIVFVLMFIAGTTLGYITNAVTSYNFIYYFSLTSLSSLCIGIIIGYLILNKKRYKVQDNK